MRRWVLLRLTLVVSVLGLTLDLNTSTMSHLHHLPTWVRTDGWVIMWVGTALALALYVTIEWLRWRWSSRSR